MMKIHKQLTVLMLPVLGLATWAFITSRPDHLVPLDETNIKQEITRQVTKQLDNGRWVNAPGFWHSFKAFKVTQCRIDLSRGLIDAKGELLCDTQHPVIKQDKISLECRLRRNQTGSHYTGTLGVPGTGVPTYWKVPVSIPVK
jgi:hypothetical protein